MSDYLTLDERRFGIPHVKSADELQRQRDRAQEAREHRRTIVVDPKPLAEMPLIEAELRALWGDR